MPYIPGGYNTNFIAGILKGDTTQIGFGIWDWVAQTFTTTEPVNSWRIAAKLYYYTANPEYLEYSLRYTEDGKPVGEDMSFSRLLQHPGETIPQGLWFPQNLEPWFILPPGTWALVIRVPGADVPWAWAARATIFLPDGFTGKCWHSEDNGVTWYEIPGKYLLHQIWGYLPATPNPPGDVISNWAPIDYVYDGRYEGFYISITTDIPCHVFMRYSLNPPLKHPIVRFKRGLAMPWNTYYCFTGWKENEQEEIGDTLVHTFIKENWPFCQTRYFYLIASKHLYSTPSASPIYKLHRDVEPTPYPVLQVDALDDNRTLRKIWGDWDTAHDSPTGAIYPYHDDPWYLLVARAGQRVSFFIHRSYLRFDTSAIPAGSFIIDALLTLYVESVDMTAQVTERHIIATQGVQGTPVIPDNYGHQLPYTINGGQVHLDDCIPGDVTVINLNLTGKSWIVPEGISQFCIRQELDVIDKAPSLGFNGLIYGSAQSVYWKRPKLVVHYIPPP